MLVLTFAEKYCLFSVSHMIDSLACVWAWFSRALAQIVEPGASNYRVMGLISIQYTVKRAQAVWGSNLGIDTFGIFEVLI